MRPLAFSIATAAVLFGAAASAQQPVPNSSDNDLVVTATRLEQMIRDFVGDVSVEQQAEEQIARWDGRICPQIAGLNVRQAQFVADRISQRAYQIGLRPGRSNCRANILIFVTPDADRFTKALTDQFPEVFDPHVTNMHNQGREALEQFVSSDAPVRWWHVSQTVSADGYVVPNTEIRRNNQDGFSGAAVMRTGVTSRVARTTRQDFNRVVLVVDASAAAGSRFDALADYVAMATLAQLNPNADTSHNDTILNLFSGAQNIPAAMTAWDIAYLEGLYSARRNATNARRQEADISRRMRTAELDDAYLEE